MVKWLTKRLGTPVKPPMLGTLGYELVGGRLLPGNSGPVAQFMYQEASGQRRKLHRVQPGRPLRVRLHLCRCRRRSEPGVARSGGAEVADADRLSLLAATLAPQRQASEETARERLRSATRMAVPAAMGV